MKISNSLEEKVKNICKKLADYDSDNISVEDYCQVYALQKELEILINDYTDG